MYIKLGEDTKFKMWPYEKADKDKIIKELGEKYLETGLDDDDLLGDEEFEKKRNAILKKT